ncbi:(2Fe-2S)-binding protein [Sphaerisporangium sp. NPDC005289]|uniref:(2Fe-2S)-binding protein n=1 Tax=Sphaerisporangium sp. NPDC005289 TaxID=3155247 RepID=UPI00339E39C9
MRADPGLVAETLAELSAIGPYYAISPGPDHGCDRAPGSNREPGSDRAPGPGPGSDRGSSSGPGSDRDPGPDREPGFNRDPGPGPGSDRGSGSGSGSGVRSDLGSGSGFGFEEDGGWRPLSELVTDTRALRAKIEDYQRRLGAEEIRVAASILFQGLAARLWSPIVGAVAARGLIPAEAPSDIHWRPAPTGPLPLRAAVTSHWVVLPDEGGSFREALLAGGDSSARDVPAGRTSSDGTVPEGGTLPEGGAESQGGAGSQGEGGPEGGGGPQGRGGSQGAGGAAEVAYRVVVTELLEPLLGAVREIAGVSVPLLWGNAASSLAGTLRTLPVARPDLGPRAARFVREVLGLGVLADTGRLAEPAPGWYSFVRVSCCLYYRVPGGGMCDDCALLDPAVREAQWAHAARRAGEGAGA